MRPLNLSISFDTFSNLSPLYVAKKYQIYWDQFLITTTFDSFPTSNSNRWIINISVISTQYDLSSLNINYSIDLLKTETIVITFVLKSSALPKTFSLQQEKLIATEDPHPRTLGTCHDNLTHIHNKL